MKESKAGEIIDGREEPEKKEYPTERILDHRFNKDGLPEFLVHWKGYSMHQATWQSHRDVLNNEHYLEYRRGLPQAVSDRMKLPKGAKIGYSEDGYCVKRAMEKLRIPDLNINVFGPWLTLEEVDEKLRNQGYRLKRLRSRDGTFGKKLLTLNGTHFEGIDCKASGHKRPRKRNDDVFYVKKLSLSKRGIRRKSRVKRARKT